MPAIVEKFFGEPIAIAILKGQITLPDMEKVYAETLGFFSDSPAPCFYQITDVRHANFSLPELLNILATVTYIVRTCNKVQIEFMLIGSNSWNTQAQAFLTEQRVDGVKLSIFSEMGQAVHYIREQSATATTSG